MDAAMAALEERFAQQRLQLADLPADRRLRDEQLLRRPREALEAAGDLETPQSGQWQASALHP